MHWVMNQGVIKFVSLKIDDGGCRMMCSDALSHHATYSDLYKFSWLQGDLQATMHPEWTCKLQAMWWFSTQCLSGFGGESDAFCFSTDVLLLFSSSVANILDGWWTDLIITLKLSHPNARDALDTSLTFMLKCISLKRNLAIFKSNYQIWWLFCLQLSMCI